MISKTRLQKIKVLVADRSKATAAAISMVIDMAPDMSCVARVDAPDRMRQQILSNSVDVILLDPGADVARWMTELEQIDQSDKDKSLILFSTRVPPLRKNWAGRVNAVVFKGCGPAELLQAIRNVKKSDSD